MSLPAIPFLGVHSASGQDTLGAVGAVTIVRISFQRHAAANTTATGRSAEVADEWERRLRGGGAVSLALYNMLVVEKSWRQHQARPHGFRHHQTSGGTW